MTSIFHRLIAAGVLATWGSVIGIIYFTGRIGAYLHPTFQIFAVVAAAVLGLFAILVLVAPDFQTSHGSAPRSTGRSLVAALILVGPLLLAFVKSPDSFGARTVANRTYVQDITQLPVAPSVEPALPDESSPPADDSAAQSSFPQNARGQLQAQVVDFLYAAQLPELRAELENKPIEVVGQLMPAKENNPKGNRFDIIRMFMTCCAADVQPLALPIEPNEAPALREMTWVKVTGRATFPVVGGQRVPLIEGAVVEKTDPPEDTYLY